MADRPPCDHLSASQAARMCYVSNNTVIKWIDSGMLPGFRVPGSRHRRVTRESLRRFMEAHGVPTDRLVIYERRGR